MKQTITPLLFLFLSTATFGQLSLQTVKDSLRQYHLGASYYFNDFYGHENYGAGFILTNDGGGAGFGNGDFGIELITLDNTGNVAWRREVKSAYEETEAQCVTQDLKGNFYVFMLSYNPDGYRGGCERVVCFDVNGKQLWDKLLGTYTLLDQPTVSYVKRLDNGRIEMRGHVVREKPTEGNDPQYRYWKAWYDDSGILTEETGEVIDWSNPEWKKKFSPE